MIRCSGYRAGGCVHAWDKVHCQHHIHTSPVTPGTPGSCHSHQSFAAKPQHWGIRPWAAVPRGCTAPCALVVTLSWLEGILWAERDLSPRIVTHNFRLKPFPLGCTVWIKKGMGGAVYARCELGNVQCHGCFPVLGANQKLTLWNNRNSRQAVKSSCGCWGKQWFLPSYSQSHSVKVNLESIVKCLWAGRVFWNYRNSLNQFTGTKGTCVKQLNATRKLKSLWLCQWAKESFLQSK